VPEAELRWKLASLKAGLGEE
jgi:hypothetical protein